MSVPRPFWSYVKKTETCWLWLGPIKEGYGRYNHLRSHECAHRVAYIELVGPIPRGKILHHKCQNKRCVNPDHLELTTIKDHPDSHANILKAKTRCAHGHEYVEGSFWLGRNYRGSVFRVCKVCYSKSYRREYLKKKGATA